MGARPTHIVDACALIAYFKGDRGHEKFASLLMDENNSLAIHCVNLCEIYYSYLRTDGIKAASTAWEKAADVLGVVEIVNEQFMKRVGHWKVEHKLCFGDAFAAATAQENACALVTTDHGHFDPIEAKGVLSIVWLR